MHFKHFSVLVHHQAAKYGNKTALKYRDYETAEWIPIFWNEFSRSVRQTANAMVALGIEVQENIGIFSQNKPECLFVDFGAYANRAVTVPLGISQEKVLFQTGVYLTRIENGHRNITVSTLITLCNTYGITLREFFNTFDDHDQVQPE